MRRLLLAAAALALMACGSGHVASSIVLDGDSSGGSSGQTSYTSSAFTVRSGWSLKYSWDCSRQASEGRSGLDRYSMDLTNADDQSFATEHPETTGQGRKGGGRFTFKRGGVYVLTVNTVCDWRVQARDGSAGRS